MADVIEEAYAVFEGAGLTTGQVFKVVPGDGTTLGAIPRDGGVNFAVASSVAEEVRLCLFDTDGNEAQVPLPDCEEGVWHGFVPGIGPGQAYGYRASGPFEPARGLRCNPNKLLLDPYARAFSGQVTYGPKLLGHDPAHPRRWHADDRTRVGGPGVPLPDRCQRREC